MSEWTWREHSCLDIRVRERILRSSKSDKSHTRYREQVSSGVCINRYEVKKWFKHTALVGSAAHNCRCVYSNIDYSLKKLMHLVGCGEDYGRCSGFCRTRIPTHSSFSQILCNGQFLPRQVLFSSWIRHFLPTMWILELYKLDVTFTYAEYYAWWILMRNSFHWELFYVSTSSTPMKYYFEYVKSKILEFNYIPSPAVR